MATPSQMISLFDKKEELHPDLKPYLNKVGKIGICLQHPLVYNVPHNDQMNAFVNAQYLARRHELEQALAAEDWALVLSLHERPFRLHTFIDILDELSNEKYWEYLGELWTDAENIWQNISSWKSLLRSERPGKEYFMTLEEMHFLSLLPDVLTVYRGYQRGLNFDGMSYTLDRKRAEWFSRRWAKPTRAGVRTRIIKKSDVFAYKSERKEDEIILLS